LPRYVPEIPLFHETPDRAHRAKKHDSVRFPWLYGCQNADGSFNPSSGQAANLKKVLGGGFKYVYFHPYLGKIPILTNIFSKGLKPPARVGLKISTPPLLKW